MTLEDHYLLAVEVLEASSVTPAINPQATQHADFLRYYQDYMGERMEELYDCMISLLEAQPRCVLCKQHEATRTWHRSDGRTHICGFCVPPNGRVGAALKSADAINNFYDWQFEVIEREYEMESNEDGDE